MQFRPSKWIIYAPVAVLPFLAALFLQGRALQDDISGRVAENIAKAGADWAKTSIDGRDVKLAGDSPSAEQLDATIAAITGTKGVRRVDSIARIVEPPPAAPTINPASGESGRLSLSGTWPEGKGNSLKISLGGKTWTSGADAALKSDGAGNWTLIPDVVLEPGTYDVTAVVTTPSGLSTADASKDEVTVVAPPELKAPTVESLETRETAPTLTGTWDPAVANRLTVTVGTTAYTLGSNPELTTEGGNWQLVIPQPLADGAYDISVEAGDERGRTVKAAAPGKLVIDTVAPQAPVINPVAPGQPVRITGTWPGKDAVSLIARLAGQAFTLGKDAAVTSDGQGNWSFAPDLKLAPGTYDIEIEIADRAGNVARDTTKDELVVPEPPPLTPPAVNALVTNTPTPVITGTWPSQLARTLAVAVGQTRYVLGTAAELKAAGDDWTLSLASPLTDGDYDVLAEVTDELGRTAGTASPARLTIDTVPPGKPVVSAFSGTLPLKLSGQWPEGDALSLVIRLAEKVWTLGKDAALTSDGKGNWSFAPDLDLAPGTYDLVVEATDRAGNVTRDDTVNEITVTVPPPPPPPPPAMAAPTVTPAVELVSRPVIRGTWSEIAAKTLTVEMAGATYALGSSPELASDGIGNWALSLTLALADGAYDVVVRTTDAVGQTLSDASRDEIVIDARGPSDPTVSLFSSEQSPAAITGRWDDANATSLKVGIPAAGISETLGSGTALSASGAVWSLALAQPLKPGSYDVVVETADARGRIARDQTRFEVMVKEPAPPPPPPPPPPPAMKVPTVNAYAGEASPSAISGTWDEAVARALTVAIMDTDVRATLGTDVALTSDGKGNWTLSLAAKLSPGIYDVVVETVDGQGNRLTDASSAEIYVKAPPPPPPPPRRLMIARACSPRSRRCSPSASPSIAGISSRPMI